MTWTHSVEGESAHPLPRELDETLPGCAFFWDIQREQATNPEGHMDTNRTAKAKQAITNMLAPQSMASHSAHDGEDENQPEDAGNDANDDSDSDSEASVQNADELDHLFSYRSPGRGSTPW